MTSDGAMYCARTIKQGCGAEQSERMRVSPGSICIATRMIPRDRNTFSTEELYTYIYELCPGQDLRRKEELTIDNRTLYWHRIMYAKWRNILLNGWVFIFISCQIIGTSAYDRYKNVIRTSSKRRTFLELLFSSCLPLRLACCILFRHFIIFFSRNGLLKLWKEKKII